MDHRMGAARSEDDVVESVRSLGYRTTLSLLQSTGSTIADRGDYLVVRTEDNRDFWWGNFLLLREPPSTERTQEWVARFEDEFPEAAHRAFGLDDPEAPAEAFAGFAALGYQLERNAVMTTGSVRHPSRPTPAATCRPLVGDADWGQHVALSLLAYPESLQQDDERVFAEARAASRRRAVEGGAGVWVGAFVEGRLVSQLGVMAAGLGLGRYQDVETHPDFRRRGLAGTLVVLAGEIMLSSFAVHTLVMVADPDDEAIRLYRSLGFTESEHELEACLPPR